MASKSRHIFDWLFRDKQGKVVIWQAPNIPLWGWLVCTVLSKVIRQGSFPSGLHALAQAFLFTWAYGEIRGGESMFRRLLGCLVLVGIVISFFR